MDYVNSNRLAAVATKKQLLWLTAGGVLLFLLGLFGEGSIRGAGIFGLICGILGYILTLYVITPWNAKRHYRNYKSIQEPLKIEMVDSGFKITADSGQSNVKWGNLLRWRKNGKYILIYFAPKIYYLIPKRLEESGLDIKNLKKSLQEKLGNPI
jgi:hypothetical protein